MKSKHQLVPRHLCATALAALALALPLSAEPAPKIPVRAFFANPQFSGPRLSDDGKSFAFIVSKGDRQVVYSREVAGGKARALASITDPDVRLAWVEWANSKRILISGQTRNPYALHMASRVTRLFGVDADGKNFSWLGRRWLHYGQEDMPITYQDRIVHWTPDDPASVLVEIDPPVYDESARVMRMNVVTGTLKTAQSPAHDISAWFADPRGQVRAGVAYKDREYYELWARIEPDAKLERVMRHPVKAGEGEFAGFHDNPSKIYLTRLHEGRDALFEFDLRTKTLGRLVFSHPQVDIDGIAVDVGRDRRVVGVRYTVDRPEVEFFDEVAESEHKELASVFAKEFGSAVIQHPVSSSADGVQQILEVSSETQPPVFYLFDRDQKSLSRILEQRPEIDHKMLAPTRRVDFAARDGLTIPAYLTLPVGVPGKNLPTIIFVHGGPWARDSIGWDPEVQLFANRGFAVFQVNFRGSTGFGEKHLTAGYREWGQKIQDDISDGVAWLISEGIADADRIGISGASFGGYASLVGLAKTPGLYRAGAAYAPVTDIELLLSDDKWYDWSYDWQETMVGGERGDKDRLRASSPLRHVAQIRMPVLLGHGIDDERVHVRQSQRMAAALKKAGKKFEYLEFPDEIHGFLLESNRIRWYEALIGFFEENLAVREGVKAEDGEAL